MYVKALQRWRSKRPGVIWDHPDGAARLLIQRGIAEPVEVFDADGNLADEFKEPQVDAPAQNNTDNARNVRRKRRSKR